MLVVSVSVLSDSLIIHGHTEFFLAAILCHAWSFGCNSATSLYTCIRDYIFCSQKTVMNDDEFRQTKAFWQRRWLTDIYYNHIHSAHHIFSVCLFGCDNWIQFCSLLMQNNTREKSAVEQKPRVQINANVGRKKSSMSMWIGFHSRDAHIFVCKYYFTCNILKSYSKN